MATTNTSTNDLRTALYLQYTLHAHLTADLNNLHSIYINALAKNKQKTKRAVRAAMQNHDALRTTVQQTIQQLEQALDKSLTTGELVRHATNPDAFNRN